LGGSPTLMSDSTPNHTWDQIHALFQEALDLDPAARESLLSARAAEDPALVAEVRSLLTAHQASTGFLADSPVAGFAHLIGPGDKLGAYRIVEEIGHGGMGVVFRAVRDDESFTKEVAIKLIDPVMRSGEILRRFLAERQILAMLEHPHIARLIDGGTAPDGSPYLVMEHVSGKPLLQYCDDRRLDVDERLALFLTVCDAVQFAHQRLVVHRDLKSDNILVTEDGSPRLLDFGIAKILAPEGAPAGARGATVTAPMHRMLTPDYAAPEQVRGDPATVAGDVYSLGVILYELLAGARPLQFETRSPEEVLRVATQVEPALPSTVAARSPAGEAARRRGDTTRRLRRRLTGDLDYIILRSLEKDPARRYGSADKFAADLRRHLEGLPVTARGGSTAYLLSRFVRRHRAAVLTVGLVGAALVVGLAGTAWQARVAGEERDRATRRFNDVKALAHAVLFDIHDGIANLPGSTKARETLVEHALRYLDGLARESRQDPSLLHELGLAYAKVADVQGRPMFPNLGQTQQALTSYDKALSLLAELAKAWPESTAVVRDQIVVSQRKADLLRVMGKHREAMAMALRDRERIEAELKKRPNDPLFRGDLSVACNRLSDMRLAAADTAGAIADCRMHLELSETFFRAAPKDPNTRRGVLIACTKMGQLQAMRGDRDSALASYLRAEALGREAVAALPNDTDASRDLSIIYGMHGLFLAETGDVDAALAVYDKGMKIAEAASVADPENVLTQGDLAAGHQEIGSILMKGGRYRAAIGEFEESFRRYARLVAADTMNTENRAWMAQSGRGAGEACEAVATRSGSAAERARWRERALTWLARSLEIYRGLEKAGALPEGEADTPAEVARLIQKVRAAG
jgi:serine/threonine protein kinase/tetratricopeptide (TPR) repeat protein